MPEASERLSRGQGVAMRANQFVILIRLAGYLRAAIIAILSRWGFNSKEGSRPLQVVLFDLSFFFCRKA